MKNLFAWVIFVMAITGCQKNELSYDISKELNTYSVTTENYGTGTKTLMNNNSPVWVSNDLAAIFRGRIEPFKYIVDESSVGSNYGLFHYVEESDYISYREYSKDIFYYPYDENLICNSSPTAGVYEIKNVILPSQQTYSHGSFGDETFPMIGIKDSDDDNSFRLNNICGIIKLPVKGNQTIKKIVLSGNNNEKISGEATVYCYSNNITPAIIMGNNATQSITLDCGNGVQLDENTENEFVISVPPLVFSKGFTIEITNSNGTTFTMATTKANVILRSSSLSMPVLVLTENGINETNQSTNNGYINTVTISQTSLDLKKGESYTLSVEISPVDATHREVVYSSSNATVAIVDKTGKVTGIGVGETIITAVATGGATATCSVKVTAQQITARDYIDSDGINHGKGVIIGDVVWAPVNCGYTTSYIPGKQYQWGRKYGQALSYASILQGPVDLTTGQSINNAGYFYENYLYDWCNVQNSKLWNKGTEENPIKTEYDPCPDGWRVPTGHELRTLQYNYSQMTTHDGQTGYWFSGENAYSDDVPKIFLPMFGYYNGDGDIITNTGAYWSSFCGDDYGAYYLLVRSYNSVFTHNLERANGFSVRCVQE